MSKEITAAGARCLGDRHDQTIARQKEALAEMRLKIKDLEVFKPPCKQLIHICTHIFTLQRENIELTLSFVL